MKKNFLKENQKKYINNNFLKMTTFSNSEIYSPKKLEIITEINEFIIKICQTELLRYFEELKEDLYLKIESDLSTVLKKLKEVSFFTIFLYSHPIYY